ncbi:MAG: RNA methyltransferase [Oscillospiraceae bacterium]|nr:RNA methyltransferase [Oscillospiraceae bacterium]
MQNRQEMIQVDAKNKTVRLFANLNRSRAMREKNHAFALEGYRLVLDALQSGVKLQCLLLTEKANQQYGDVLRAAAKQIRILLISEAVAREISDTDTTQGVFSIADMLPVREHMPQKKERCMMLHCLQDPSNLGAVLRTAEALGTDGLYLFQCCDLYNPKTVRSSMGALFRVPVYRVTDDKAFLTECRNNEIATCAAVVDRDAKLLGTYSFAEGAVVLIGNEGNGLPAEISSQCAVKLTIPMSPASNSLNAAMAAGLFLWEMAKS